MDTTMNQQTVIIREIDGLQIVAGFGRRSIEPVQTRAVVDGLIEDTDEFRAVEAKQAECKAKLAEAGTAFKNAANARIDSVQAVAGMVIYAQGQEIVAELAELLPPLKAKRQALMVEHAVYFDPAKYEHPQSDTQIDALRSKMAGGGLVSMDGLKIEDNRGVVACTDLGESWEVRRILTLGEKVPGGAVLFDDLDIEQRVKVDLQIERDLAAGMRVSDRAAARSVAETRALEGSVALRSGLEIKKDPDALDKARVVYDARMAEIAEIYQ